MQFYKIVLGYLNFVFYKIFSSYRQKRIIEAQKRINICQQCEYFDINIRICKICGCFMDIKTKMTFKLDDEYLSIDGCPDRRW